MTFDFDDSLSQTARAKPAAQPFSGLVPYHFVGGNIDEPTVPAEALAEVMAEVLRAEGHAMGKYGMNSGPQGYLPLREEIARILSRRAGMSAPADEILVTSGSLQAMDLVNRALLDAGDTVLLEEANYAGAVSKLRALGVTPHPVKLDRHGMDMDDLARQLDALAAQGVKPKFIYTIPTVQNPTASVLPEDRRRRMLELAARHDVAIFEDDCYADLCFDPESRPPAIHALDTENRVIYCGTFSKTIAPALRMGYLVAPWPMMGRILPLKTDAGTGALEQMVLARYLPGQYDAHVDALLPMLREKADTLCAALDEHFGAAAQYERPEGGIYLWVTLPESVDTDRLYPAALEHGIEINPGSQWSVVGQEHRHRMRICFGHPPLETIREGIARLAEVCHAEFGQPERSGNVAR